MMRQTNEPHEIMEARELLSEFERSAGLSKKRCFADGMEILNDFLAAHPRSKFSQRVNNLKTVYTKLLIKRLGSTLFPNANDWTDVFAWVYAKLGADEIERFTTDPELSEDWKSFLGNLFYLTFG